MAAPRPPESEFEAWVDRLTEMGVWKYTGYAATAMLGGFLVLVMLGGRLGILNYLGLSWVFSKETGVYTDCSKPENANVPYCQPKLGAGDREWDQLNRSGGKSVPFTLHD